MSAKLMLHVNAFSATRDEVAAIETPARTNTWEPLPHVIIPEIILEEADKLNLKVRREQYGLTKDGARMFGTIDFEGGDLHHGYCVGFRNSHDKSMSAGVVAGARVFVCDNLALSGEYQESRIHRPGHEFNRALRAAFDVLPARMEELFKKLDYLKAEGIEDDDAKKFLFDAALNNVINFSDMGIVWDEYKKPTYPEFSDPTQYNLLMAITEKYKTKSSITVLNSMYRRCAEMFGL